MEYHQENLPEIINKLESDIPLVKRKAEDYSRRHFNGIREKALIYCLVRASDIAEGCLLAAKANLPESLNTLRRSLFETLLWTRWILISDKNARMFKETAVNQLRQLARKILKAGNTRVVSISTGEDKTQEFLDSPTAKEIPQRKHFDKLAEETGLEKIYTAMYGYWSIQSHGSSFGLQVDKVEEIEEDIFPPLLMVVGLLQCIDVTVEDWITKRKQTPTAVVTRILGM